MTVAAARTATVNDCLPQLALAEAPLAAPTLRTCGLCPRARLKRSVDPL
jgi:hypothetical protein